MPLGTREVLVAVRARDVASRVLREVGANFFQLGRGAQIAGDKAFVASQRANESLKQSKDAARAASLEFETTNRSLLNTGAALTALGVVMAGTGAVLTSALNNATDSAIEYNRQAALALTQVDQLGVGVEDLEAIGTRVANKIPAPFDQMQTALFDIFSSMDVNVKGAEDLLAEFSRAAVAGQVDVQTAARGTIGILNAYQLPVTEVNRINDVMFQLVRKGIGSYDEFASAIGRAVPAAVASGQSIETLAGLMAFLTRQGLSTEMAATSAARAMELFSKPDVTAALEGIGVQVVDATGNFRQLDDIIKDIGDSEGWAQLAAPERKKIFEDIFGTGTIQARRFFDTAIPGFTSVNEFVDLMGGAAGEMDRAYGIMFDSPAMKAQLLQNRYDMLKQEVGNELIPAKMALMNAVMKVLKWWQNLDDGTKSLIIKIVAITAAFLTIVGVVITVVGAFMMFAAMVNAAGFGLAAVSVAIGVVIIAIVAIIAIGILLVKNWGTIKEWAGIVWHAVRDFALAAWQTLQDFWDWLTKNAVDIWHTIHAAATEAWGSIKETVITVWDAIFSAVTTAVGKVIAAAQQLWDWLKTAGAWLDKHFGEGFMKVWNSLVDGVGGVVSEIIETLQMLWNGIRDGAVNFVFPVIKMLTGMFAEWVKFLVGIFKSTLIPAFTILWAGIQLAFIIIKTALTILWEFMKLVFNNIVDIVIVALNIIRTTIEFVWGIIVAIWENFGSIIFEEVKKVWNLITTTISTVITIISNIIQFVLNLIQGDWDEAWENIKNILSAAWDFIMAAIDFAFSTIKTFFVGLPMAIIGFIGDVGSLLWEKGSDIIGSLWNGIKALWENVKEWFLGSNGRGGVKNAIKDFFSNAFEWLKESGKNIIRGLKNGITTALETIGDFLGGIKDKIVDGFKSVFGIHSPSSVMMEIGGAIIQGLIKGIFTTARNIPAVVKSIGLSFVDLVKIVGQGAFGAFGTIADKIGLDSLFGGISGGLDIRAMIEDMQGGGGRGGGAGLVGNAAIAHELLSQMFPGMVIGGYRAQGSVPGSDHPKGKALDLMTSNSAIANFIIQAFKAMSGAKYWIWNRQIATANSGWNPRPYSGPSPHTDHVHLSFFKKGAWELMRDQLAFLHKGEMVVPARPADMLRSAVANPGGRGGTAFSGSGIFIENAHFGSENVVNDLDWWATINLSGV